ncbi:MAG: hypothetical protein ACYSU7_14940 [Planctomycetota bacterium]|jgi:hypothetical protein
MRRLLRTSLFALLLLAGGCAANPIKAWQASLEEYVVNHGNGDLNVLRRPDRNPSESDFPLIGASRSGVLFIAPVRTDANGELLGLERIRDRNWYVYLVGFVEYRGSFVDFPSDDAHLTDIRIAAVTGTGGEFEWLVSEQDADALHRYCGPQVEAWRQSHPDRAQDTTAPTRFPTPADDLQMIVAPPALTVTDEHSRAKWTLSLETRNDTPR